MERARGPGGEGLAGGQGHLSWTAPRAGSLGTNGEEVGEGK